MKDVNVGAINKVINNEKLKRGLIIYISRKFSKKISFIASI